MDIFYFDRLFNGVVGWGYSIHRGWTVVLKYYKVDECVDSVKEVVLKLKRYFYSGFCSKTRGLHWNRCRE